MLLILGNLIQMSVDQINNNLFYHLIIHIIEKYGAIMLTSIFKPNLFLFFIFFLVCKDLTWEIIFNIDFTPFHYLLSL